MFFVFKQKTAYEVRISDWSSDVCSSDLIGGDRFAGSPGRQMPGGILLPAFVLAPHFGDLDAAMMFMDRAERRARFDRLQLLRIADQHDLRARVGGMGEDAFHLACADHPRLIDDADIARAEQIAPLRPTMFAARDGARRDARAVLPTFGGDARELGRAPVRRKGGN